MNIPGKLIPILAIISFAASCGWQRVDAPPAFQANAMPIAVGLNPTENPYSKGLAPDLAEELKNIGLFQNVVFPYRAGDDVGCLLNFDATGTVEAEGVGAGIASGLTFGLAGTVVGPSTTLIHDISFHLTNSTTDVGKHQVHVESKAEFGVFADTTEVAHKQAALHNRQIAVAIAQKLEQDRDAIISTCTGYT